MEEIKENKKSYIILQFSQ